MKKQYLLKFGLPDGVTIYPNQFREGLAKTELLPSHFFTPTGRIEGDGPGFSVPTVRIVGGCRWLGVVVTGEENSGLMSMALPAGIEAIRSVTKRAVSVEQQEFTLRLVRTDSLLPYYVGRMAIKLRSAKAWEMTRDENRIGGLVGERVVDGLRRTAVASGLDFPEASDILMTVTETAIRNFPQLVVSKTDTCAGATNEHFMLIDARFQTNFILSGLWSVGNLTSRGYGRIGRVIHGVPLRRPEVGAEGGR